MLDDLDIFKPLPSLFEEFMLARCLLEEMLVDDLVLSRMDFHFIFNHFPELCLQLQLVLLDQLLPEQLEVLLAPHSLAPDFLFEDFVPDFRPHSLRHRGEVGPDQVAHGNEDDEPATVNLDAGVLVEVGEAEVAHGHHVVVDLVEQLQVVLRPLDEGLLVG